MAGRPTESGQGGKWSWRQIAKHAKVTHHKTRDLVAEGYLSDRDLTGDGVLYARVAAAIADAALPTNVSRKASATAVRQRNERAMALVRSLDLAALADDALIYVTPTEATLHERHYTLIPLLAEGTQEALIVPLGKWAADIRSGLTTSPRTSAEA